MTNVTRAKKLAKSLVSVANASNCKTRALITNMDDPLSSAIGNALEVETVVDVLLGKNKNEKALLDTTIALSIELYSMVYPAKSKTEISETQAKRKLKPIREHALGNILVKIGGGRQKASDNLNLSVGFTKVVKSNERVDANEALLMLHYPDKYLSSSLEEEINNCFTISGRDPAQPINPILQKIV